MTSFDWAVGSGLDTDMSGEGSYDNETNRFYMKQGETREVVLLNDGKDTVTIWEHQVQINGDWKNFASCLQMINKPCPLCQYAEEHDKYKRSKVQYFSAIDLTGWKDKKGNMHKNNRVLIPMKKQTIEIMQRRYLQLRDDGLDFRGAKFEVYRSTANQSASVGTEWLYKKHVDLDELEVNTSIHDFAGILSVTPEMEARAAKFAAKLGYGVADDGDNGDITNQEVSYE